MTTEELQLHHGLPHQPANVHISEDFMDMFNNHSLHNGSAEDNADCKMMSTNENLTNGTALVDLEDLEDIPKTIELLGLYHGKDKASVIRRSVTLRKKPTRQGLRNSLFKSMDDTEWQNLMNSSMSNPAVDSHDDAINTKFVQPNRHSVALPVVPKDFFKLKGKPLRRLKSSNESREDIASQAIEQTLTSKTPVPSEVRELQQREESLPSGITRRQVLLPLRSGTTHTHQSNDAISDVIFELPIWNENTNSPRQNNTLPDEKQFHTPKLRKVESQSQQSNFQQLRRENDESLVDDTLATEKLPLGKIVPQLSPIKHIQISNLEADEKIDNNDIMPNWCKSPPVTLSPRAISSMQDEHFLNSQTASAKLTSSNHYKANTRVRCRTGQRRLNPITKEKRLPECLEPAWIKQAVEKQKRASLILEQEIQLATGQTPDRQNSQELLLRPKQNDAHYAQIEKENERYIAPLWWKEPRNRCSSRSSISSIPEASIPEEPEFIKIAREKQTRLKSMLLTNTNHTQ